jgi:PAS domain S-box-containing protein
MRLTIFFLLFFGFAHLVFAGASEVTFVGDDHRPPISFTKDGLGKGLWFDFARAVAHQLGMPYTLEVEAWEKAQADVQAGKADILFGVSFCKETAGLYDLSLPVSRSSYTFFSLGKPGLDAAKAVSGLRVGVVQGGLPPPVVAALGASIMVPFATHEEAFTALAEGKIDALAADRWAGSYVLSHGQWDGVTSSPGDFLVLETGFAVRKGNITLRDKLNATILELKKDGTFDSISDRWTAKEVVYVTHEELFNAISAGLAAALLILGLWVFVLIRGNRQRKRIETSLMKQTAQFRTLLDALPDLVWIKDVGGVFLSCNRPFAELYGRSEEEIIGKTDYDYLERGRAERFAEGDKKVVAGEARVVIEEAALFSDGTTRLMETTKQAVHDGAGRLLGVLGISRDITERREKERERLRLLSELQQSQKIESLGTLAGGIAHDINNVLAAILALATVGLSRNPPDSANFSAFNTIAKASTRGGKMVKNILAFARKSPAKVERIDVNSLIREEVALLERTAPPTIRIAMDLDSGLALIQGDSDALGGALMNLCVNAVQAMPGAGVLTIRTRNAGSTVEIQIADTGVGMPKHILEKAIEPFFTTKPVGQGTGLGLATAYALAKAHGGRLEIASEVGKGTVVTLAFPISSGDPAAVPSGGKASVSRADALTLHVLVVDDDELVQAALGESIEALGHHVTVAADGETALGLLESGLEPDVVVLDMNMPGWGGSETLGRIREVSQHLPVILSTGRLDQAAVDLGARTPQVALLAKPYTLEELDHQLRQAVRAK